MPTQDLIVSRRHGLRSSFVVRREEDGPRRSQTLSPFGQVNEASKLKDRLCIDLAELPILTRTPNYPSYEHHQAISSISGDSGDLPKSMEMRPTRPASAEAGVYRPLNESAREIRLAHIMPTQDEVVQMELQNVSLDDSPEYDALSYVWGDPGITKPIIVDGRRVDVTVSLEAAFKKFRQQADGAVVVVWADAICINQKDMHERGQQVSIMSDIYRNAKRVRAWLGELPHGAADAFQRVITASIDRSVGNYKESTEPWTEEQIEAVLQEAQALLKPGETFVQFARALRPIAEHPYWTRKWIVQEAALACSFRLHMGDEWVDLSDMVEKEPMGRWTMPWTLLGNIKFALGQRRTSSATKRTTHTPGSDSDDMEDISLAMASCLTSIASTHLHVIIGNALKPASKIISDFNVIHSTRETQCSDPRDCVFAIQGLLYLPNSVPSDYRATVTDIFTRFTISIIKYTQSLRILDFACSAKGSLPSWVPDFTRPGPALHSTPGSNASAISSVAAPILQPESGKLQVPALVLNCIVALPPAHDPRGPGAGRLTRALVLDVYNYWNETYKTIESLTNELELADSDEFWQTLYGCDTGVLKNMLHTDSVDLRRSWREFQEGTCEDFETQDHMICLLTDFIDRYSLFFVSSGGTGAVPLTVINNVNPEDCLYVVIIASAKLPFLARREQGRHDGTFKLLSPCFVPGIMNGEAVQHTARLLHHLDEDEFDQLFSPITLI